MKKLKQEEIDAAIACSAEYGTLIKALDESLYHTDQRLKVTEKALHNAVRLIQCARCPYKDNPRSANDAVSDCFAEFLEQAAIELGAAL